MPACSVAAELVLDRELNIVCIRNLVCLRQWLLAWFPRGGSRILKLGGGGDDNNRLSNYTLIYFLKLPYVCPKTWRFRKDNGLFASQGFCDPRISIFFGDPHISVNLFFHVQFIFLGGLATQSTTPPPLPLLDPPLFPSPPSPSDFYQPKQNML